MARSDFRTKRMFVEDDLEQDLQIVPDKAQSNYLLNVLRLNSGDHIIVFNGRDGEWMAKLLSTGKKSCSLSIFKLLREQPAPFALEYWFAPLKQARLDYMVQKAVEMGAGILRPVFTDHTQAHRINLERVKANSMEAAEQCGILNVPEIFAAQKLEKALASLESDQTLIYCDELEESQQALEQLRSMKRKKLAILIGPEGGFSPRERAFLKNNPQVITISLGPRILRADTAAVAALSLVQAISGDWYED